NGSRGDSARCRRLRARAPSHRSGATIRFGMQGSRCGTRASHGPFPSSPLSLDRRPYRLPRSCGTFECAASTLIRDGRAHRVPFSVDGRSLGAEWADWSSAAIYRRATTVLATEAGNGSTVSGRRLAGAALAVMCVGSIVAACAPVKPPPAPQQPPLPPPPPDLEPPAGSPTLTTDTNFVTGLTNPWDMAFLPDGTMFFTQRPGPVQVRLPNGTINNIVTPGDLLSANEAGMNGIAIDPNFASNRFIYTYYSSIANDNRIVRWQVNATLNGIDGSAVITSGIPRALSHGGGRVRLGPDGNLWFTTGDNQIGPLPQDLSQLGGKIGRINSNGAIPSDNPFVGQPGIDGRIYTYGHRNPQGIAFRPGNGAP